MLAYSTLYSLQRKNWHCKAKGFGKSGTEIQLPDKVNHFISLYQNSSAKSVEQTFPFFTHCLVFKNHEDTHCSLLLMILDVQKECLTWTVISCISEIFLNDTVITATWVDGNRDSEQHLLNDKWAIRIFLHQLFITHGILGTEKCKGDVLFLYPPSSPYRLSKNNRKGF